MYEMFSYILMILLGLSIGSFLNVLILRIPKAKNIAYPASYCPKCNKPLKWWHNIPIISYLLLRGKCHYCKESISIQYPLVEFVSTLIFVLSYWKIGDFAHSIVVALVFDMLLALSLIDFKYKAVPDSLNLLALSLAIFSSNIILSFTNALLFAGGFTLLRFYVSFFVKKEALGEADIMIAATIGAMVGVKLGLFTIFLSALIALPVFIAVGKRDIQLPFIPFLALSLFVAYFFDGYFLYLLDRLYQ